jgi:hypothetical protein
MNLINETNNQPLLNDLNNENSNSSMNHYDDSLLNEHNNNNNNSQTSFSDLMLQQQLQDPNLVIEVDSMGNSIVKKRRKQNPDKDKYIQEPQYVTKQTSSGRLVKMKISTDFNYESDQDNEKGAKDRETDSLNGSKRKRRDNYDDGTREGIQVKHIKNNPELENALLINNNISDGSMNDSIGSENNSSESDNNSSEEDEDFFARKKPTSTYKRKTNRPYRRRSQSGGGGVVVSNVSNGTTTTIRSTTATLISHQPRKRNTIRSMTEQAALMNQNEKTTASTTASIEASFSQKFDERKLQLSQTMSTANDTLKTRINLSSSMPPSILKLENVSSNENNNRPKLSIPIINPVYKNLVNNNNVSANLVNQVLNPNSAPNSTTTTPKIIKFVTSPVCTPANGASPQLNTSLTGEKKLVIINNPLVKPAIGMQTVQTAQSGNVVKIININSNNLTTSSSSSSSSVVAGLNNGLNANNKVLVLKNPNEIVTVNKNQNEQLKQDNAVTVSTMPIPLDKQESAVKQD